MRRCSIGETSIVPVAGTWSASPAALRVPDNAPDTVPNSRNSSGVSATTSKRIGPPLGQALPAAVPGDTGCQVPDITSLNSIPFGITMLPSLPPTSASAARSRSVRPFRHDQWYNGSANDAHRTTIPTSGGVRGPIPKAAGTAVPPRPGGGPADRRDAGRRLPTRDDSAPRARTRRTVGYQSDLPPPGHRPDGAGRTGQIPARGGHRGVRPAVGQRQRHRPPGPCRRRASDRRRAAGGSRAARRAGRATRGEPIDHGRRGHPRRTAGGGAFRPQWRSATGGRARVLLGIGRGDRQPAPPSDDAMAGGALRRHRTDLRQRVL